MQMVGIASRIVPVSCNTVGLPTTPFLYNGDFMRVEIIFVISMFIDHMQPKLSIVVKSLRSLCINSAVCFGLLINVYWNVQSLIHMAMKLSYRINYNDGISTVWQHSIVSDDTHTNASLFSASILKLMSRIGWDSHVCAIYGRTCLAQKLANEQALFLRFPSLDKSR